VCRQAGSTSVLAKNDRLYPFGDPQEDAQSALHQQDRRPSLVAIPRERVDLASDRIYLDTMTTKNKTLRFLPMYGEMRGYLEMQLAELDAKYPGCRWLIHRMGQRIYSFNKKWHAVTAVAGGPPWNPYLLACIYII